MGLLEDKERVADPIIQDMEPTQDRMAPTLLGVRVDKVVSHPGKTQTLLLMQDRHLGMVPAAVVVAHVQTQDGTLRGREGTVAPGNA